MSDTIVGMQDKAWSQGFKSGWNSAIDVAMEKFKTQFVASEVIIEMLKELKK